MRSQVKRTSWAFLLAVTFVLNLPAVAYANVIIYPIYPTDVGGVGLMPEFTATAVVTLVASGLCMVLGWMSLRKVRLESTAESGGADSERTGGEQA